MGWVFITPTNSTRFISLMVSDLPEVWFRRGCSPYWQLRPWWRMNSGMGFATTGNDMLLRKKPVASAQPMSGTPQKKAFLHFRTFFFSAAKMASPLASAALPGTHAAAVTSAPTVATCAHAGTQNGAGKQSEREGEEGLGIHGIDREKVARRKLRWIVNWPR